MAIRIYKEPEVWQKIAEAQGSLLPGVKPGGRVAVISKQELGESSGEMIVWVSKDQTTGFDKRPFQGFRNSDADLMFVVDEELLVNVCENTQENPIPKLRHGIRQGSVLCYFLRPKRELINIGYEEFVDLLGLPLAGCQ
ncbi:MAG: hypothetical protein M1358_24030 [Chloroflexi bacterium]|nr:hypothetical protein [Chloroflexota bacterium]